MQVRHAQLLLEMLVRLGLDHCGLEFSGWDAAMEQDIELVVRPVLELRQAKVAPHDAECADGEL
jgi:hypothetical protein